MYYNCFKFYHQSIQSNTAVSSDLLYSPEQGFGFVTEQNRNLLSSLQIAELNAGFEPYYWLKSENLTKLSASDNGIGLKEGIGLPLIFKVDVPKQKNYLIKVKIHADERGIHNLFLFAGRRHLVAKRETILPLECFTAEAAINICDIIPRGKTERFQDTSLDFTIIADHPVISELSIEEIECPTIYIAGDSTVTDQVTAYPYDPGNSYCGWGQMLSYYFTSGVSISNHAHSGLTTESFRSEGHYSIIEKQIKPGDYFFLQFAHNDQKLPHLSAFDGYLNNIIQYIREIREKQAFPVIITPVARNTWKSNGSYNDLLSDYAAACKEAGDKCQVPVIDLHEKSKRFVIQEGLEHAATYYFPKDYTHNNDYGGYLMAGLIAEDCCQIPSLKSYLCNCTPSASDSKSLQGGYQTDWLPPEIIVQPTPPPDFIVNDCSLFPVNFKDIEQSSYKTDIISLTQAGIISNSEENFRCSDLITRVEALDWVVKSVRFVPTNVYNDKYPDVIGHEWYAGIVEVVCQNDIVNEALTSDGYFHPLDTVTSEQLISFCVTSYKCRKTIKASLPDISIPEVSSWAAEDIKTAVWLNLISSDFNPGKELTREEAAKYIKRLTDLL